MHPEAYQGPTVNTTQIRLEALISRNGQCWSSHCESLVPEADSVAELYSVSWAGLG